VVKALIQPAHIEDEKLSRPIDDIIEQVNNLLRIDITDGIQLTDVDLTTTEVEVPHSLGRRPLGYIVTKLSANATVFGTVLNSSFIKLTSSATVTVDLWVY